METAVRLGLDLVILILRDDGYGMIKWKQAHMAFRDFGLDFGNPDFVAYAQSYGAHGHRLASTVEFKPVLDKCFETGGVHLIDVQVDYSQNHQVLNEDIRELAAKL